jgi:hypothetical protein
LELIAEYNFVKTNAVIMEHAIKVVVNVQKVGKERTVV